MSNPNPNNQDAEETPVSTEIEGVESIESTAPTKVTRQSRLGEILYLAPELRMMIFPHSFRWMRFFEEPALLQAVPGNLSLEEEVQEAYEKSTVTVTATNDAWFRSLKMLEILKSRHITLAEGPKDPSNVLRSPRGPVLRSARATAATIA
ncbi:hypothetical protein G7Y89_g4657 [Cudoniella acicularis]|uniref:Uncharacterized protein n=1 Tax=Cudoniella acicularis TaxID=354080 RepID=A0A8H4W4R7_9HELO|nr:hypothetical protein G7Y89_g4657 [Cudoniella acicularis]